MPVPELVKLVLPEAVSQILIDLAQLPGDFFPLTEVEIEDLLLLFGVPDLVD
jgi:hypothetical protein